MMYKAELTGILSRSYTRTERNYAVVLRLIHLLFLLKHSVKMRAKRLTPMPLVSRLCFYVKRLFLLRSVCWLVCLSGYAIGAVCHSVCERDYCKSDEPISLKLGVMIGPTNRKN